MDIEQFKEQMRVLRRLKRRSLRDLRKMHDKRFSGTEWYIKLPGWASKDTLVRRLWYLYCYGHYHYPEGHEITAHFRKKAAKFLDPANLAEHHQEDETQRRLGELERFSRRNILSMDVNTIDRFLAGLNMHLEAPPAIRRKVLWEYFNLPQTRMIQTNNAKGNKVRRYRRGRINNKYVMRDLILANPGMGYDAFAATYGEVMPTVTRASFNTARCLLRKTGYTLERLKPGPAHPVVVEGENGDYKKGRLES